MKSKDKKAESIVEKFKKRESSDAIVPKALPREGVSLWFYILFGGTCVILIGGMFLWKLKFKNLT